MGRDRKQSLRHQLRQQIEDELTTIERSAQNAREAATHAESKAENKYDTRGLEASYLAGAQKERAAELRGALLLTRALELKVFAPSDKIAPTALVELEHEGQKSLCFLVIWGAGYQLESEGCLVTTITPQSPLGKALLGKHSGDVVTIKTSLGKKDYEVLTVC
jgi:transcription elongation GreA/GreB family factor